MPGPLHRIYVTGSLTVQDIHRLAQCPMGANCNGPGCHVRTGKTHDRRLPVTQRHYAIQGEYTRKAQTAMTNAARKDMARS